MNAWCDVFSRFVAVGTLVSDGVLCLHLYRTHDQCGDTIEKLQAPDDGCIYVRNIFSIEEVK